VLQSVVLQSAVLGRLLHAAAPHSLYVASSGIKLSFWCGSGNSQLLTKVATPVFREDLVPHVVLQRDALQCFTHAQMHLYTHTHAHTHAHTRTHIHTHTHAYAHTHAHAHTRTRKHTHHTPVHPHALSPGNTAVSSSAEKAFDFCIAHIPLHSLLWRVCVLDSARTCSHYS
jgi:ABC-type Zn2+ transport system substrate-binding protein/surface adhesin